MISDKFDSHKMSENGVDLSSQIRDIASALDNLLGLITDSRESSLAKTKLEECVMWANKGIALRDTKIKE